MLVVHHIGRDVLEVDLHVSSFVRIQLEQPYLSFSQSLFGEPRQIAVPTLHRHDVCVGVHVLRIHVGVNSECGGIGEVLEVGVDLASSIEVSLRGGDVDLVQVEAAAVVLAVVGDLNDGLPRHTGVHHVVQLGLVGTQLVVNLRGSAGQGKGVEELVARRRLVPACEIGGVALPHIRQVTGPLLVHHRAEVVHILAGVPHRVHVVLVVDAGEHVVVVILLLVAPVEEELGSDARDAVRTDVPRSDYERGLRHHTRHSQIISFGCGDLVLAPSRMLSQIR